MHSVYFCIRVASGPRVKLANCKSALNHPAVYSTDPSKEVVRVLFLLFVLFFFSICAMILGEALWSLSSIAALFTFCFTSCVVLLAFWSPLTAAHFAFCLTSCD